MSRRLSGSAGPSTRSLELRSSSGAAHRVGGRDPILEGKHRAFLLLTEGQQHIRFLVRRLVPPRAQVSRRCVSCDKVDVGCAGRLTPAGDIHDAAGPDISSPRPPDELRARRACLPQRRAHTEAHSAGLGGPCAHRQAAGATCVRILRLEYIRGAARGRCGGQATSYLGGTNRARTSLRLRGLPARSCLACTSGRAPRAGLHG